MIHLQVLWFAALWYYCTYTVVCCTMVLVIQSVEISSLPMHHMTQYWKPEPNHTSGKIKVTPPADCHTTSFKPKL